VKILDRYVLLAFLKNYLISFMVLIGLYIVLDLVFNFDELIEGQTRNAAIGGLASFVSVLYVIWDYYFYQVFLIYAQLSGVIAVVAAAFTLVRLSRFNELTATLAAGVPLLRIAAPIIIASLVLNVLLLADQEAVIPRLIPKLNRKHDEVGQRTTSTWYRLNAMQDEKRGLLFAGRYTPPTEHSPAEMREFDLIERDEHDNPTAFLTAQQATWDGKAWALTGGRRVTGIQPNQRRSRPQVVKEYSSDVTPEEIELFRSGDYVELLSTARINELLAPERAASFGAIDLLRVKHARVTQWFMNVVAVLLGIGCILTREPGRLKIDGAKLLIGVGLAMASVFLCHQIAAHPPAGAQWADRWPAIMAWIPIFIFGPLAIFLLDRMHTRKS
jgi:lipopolysaccharide export system permease protein